MECKCQVERSGHTSLITFTLFLSCPCVFCETSMIAFCLVDFLDGQRMKYIYLACPTVKTPTKTNKQTFLSYCVSRDVDDCLSLGWLPWWATDDATGSDLQISQATICRVPQPKRSQWGQKNYGEAYIFLCFFVCIYITHCYFTILKHKKRALSNFAFPHC